MLDYIWMEGLILTEIICHVLDFVLLQLMTMHLTHVKLNSICSRCLTHQVFYLLFAIDSFPFLEVRPKSAMLVLFLNLLQLHASLTEYAVLVPFLLSFVKLLKI